MVSILTRGMPLLYERLDTLGRRGIRYTHNQIALDVSDPF